MTTSPSQQAIRGRCFHPSGAFVPFSKEEIEQSILSRFANIVARYPGRVAVKANDRALTYAELNAAANRVGHAILGRRGGKTEPVALLFANGASFVVASLGALKAGRIQVPLESGFPRARLKYVIEHSQASLIVTDSAHLAAARELAGLPLINIDELDGALSVADPAMDIQPDAIASVAYTSGSTGQPKGVVWNHRGVLHAVMRHTNTSHMSAEDRLVMFRASLRAYLYALLNGATYYPVDLSREEPAGLARLLAEERITVYRAAVSAFRSFAGSLSGVESFPDLRLILLFGEPVYPSEVALYRRHFAGAAILGCSLGCMEFDDYAYFFLDKNTPLPRGAVPGGYLIDDVEIVFLDEEGRTVGIDQIGEIAIRSRYNTAGYWRRPDLTEAAFLPAADGNGKRVYRTGDMGRIDAGGCIFHLGRKDFQLKIRGYRVEAAEVETALLEIDGVREAVVAGWEERPGNKRLVAYIVSSGALPAVGELRRLLGDKLPDYMVPFTFVTLDALPLTATGKVDRRALPPPQGTRPALDIPFVAPRTPAEEKLAGIWAATLGLDRVGAEDDFLELGGDSLSATRVVSRVMLEFHVRLPLRLLFEASTVARMAQIVAEHSAATSTGQRPGPIAAEPAAYPKR